MAPGHYRQRRPELPSAKARVRQAAVSVEVETLPARAGAPEILEVLAENAVPRARASASLRVLAVSPSPIWGVSQAPAQQGGEAQALTAPQGLKVVVPALGEGPVLTPPGEAALRAFL